MKRLLLLVMTAALVAGCSSGIVPAGPDTYMVSRSIEVFSTGAGGKAALYREANDWCMKRGLIMVPVSTDAREPVVGGRLGSAELVFRALRPGDPEIKRNSVEKPDYIQRVEAR